jgi:hypothetical protein
MTVLQWLTSIWGIVPIVTLAVLYVLSVRDDKAEARANHPTALPVTDEDNDGFLIDYPEMYR